MGQGLRRREDAHHRVPAVVNGALGLECQPGLVGPRLGHLLAGSSQDGVTSSP